MQRILMTAVILGSFAAMTVPASAFFKQDAGDRYEQEKIRDAEFKRSTRVGGYSDPISAFMDLIRGEVKDKDLQQGISTRYEAEAELYRIPDAKE